MLVIILIMIGGVYVFDNNLYDLDVCVEMLRFIFDYKF